MASDRTCTKCGETFPLTSFRRDKKGREGRAAQCKGCRYRADVAWVTANRLRVRRYFHEYNQRPEAKAKKRQRVREWRAKNADKHRAHVRVRSATTRKTNRIERPDRCEACGRREWIIAHHPDYSRPEYVWFVCQECHRTFHMDDERAAHA